MRIITKSKHGRIRLITREAMSEQETTKAMKPSTRSLFQAVGNFLKMAHMGRKIKINEARGLTHVNIFSKETMKKDILNIKLMNKPVIGNYNG